MVADRLVGFLDALVAWLMTYALHSTVLIAAAWLAAVAIARVACRSQGLRDALPSIRERLWKMALVGGLVTASLQSALGLDPWGLKLALHPSVAADSFVATQEFAPEVQEVSSAPTSGRDRSAAVTSVPAQAVHATPTAIVPLAMAPVVSSPRNAWTSWVVVALALWGAGVLFGLARWACQWNRLLRNLDDREPIVSGHVYEIFQHLRLRGSVRRDVRLSAAPGLNAPITLGIWRSEICLPPRVATELQHDEIGALLAHELAHAERRDPMWVVACRAIEIVFFFQPLNRVCASWLADEAEYLCDDRAVVRIGERVALASCLTEIAGWIVRSTPTRLAPGMAAPGTRLSLRVGRLLDEDHDPAASTPSRWMTFALLPAALSIVVIVPGVVAESRADGDDADRAPVDLASDAGLLDRARELEIAYQDQPASSATTNDAADSSDAFDPEASATEQPDAVVEPTVDTTIDRSAVAPPAPPSTASVSHESGTKHATKSTLAHSSAEPSAITKNAEDDLALIGEEIARLRAELSTRTGGKSLAHRLDALDKRRQALEKSMNDLNARMQQLEEARVPTATPYTVSDTSMYLIPIPTKG